MMPAILPHNFGFANPAYFALLLLLPLLVWWRRRQLRPAFRLSAAVAASRLSSGMRPRLIPLLFVLRVSALVLLITALARPQLSNVTDFIDSEGIDIMLALDVSGSMLAEDLKPNRLEAAKQIISEFIDDRPGDRIGLVIFSGESFTQCPLTVDHGVLKNQTAQVQSGVLRDGTAIGDGLATAVDRIRNATGKSKVVILLTDGVNNQGKIGPETALEVAKAFKVKVYTIGAGSEGQAMSPVQTPQGMVMQLTKVEIDEPLLKKIAQQSGGQYFRATSTGALKSIYAEIDRLEKTRVEQTSFREHRDLFLPLLLIALGCLIAELLLRYTYLRSVTGT